MAEVSGDWVTRGKTISGLIEELMTFSDRNCVVEISLDGGFTSRPISLVIGDGEKCLLINMEDVSE